MSDLQQECTDFPKN